MKPIFIQSKILGERICFSDLPLQGHTCYSPKERGLLKAVEKSMGREEYCSWLRKIHLVKKTFPGSIIEEIKVEVQQVETGEAANVSKDEQANLPFAELRVEDAERSVASPIQEQKSLWEL